MYFKLLIIVISLLDPLHSLNYYEYATGIEYNSYTAKSMSMGSTSSITDNSGLALFINPSNISIRDDASFSFISSYISNSSLERRGITMKDSSGDYLAESDYVRNNSYNNLQKKPL